ncbi:MAG: TetR/AcrR family transcriptional regulator [Myxococcota bacterium]
MSKSSRSRLQNDERRAQLIALGVRLFSSRPYEAVSIDEIAEQAGISRGLLYHYFGNKRGFYVACLEQAAAGLAEHIRPPPEEPSDLNAVVRALERYLGWVEERADAYLALMHGGMGRDREAWAIIEQTRDGIIHNVLDQLGVDRDHPVYATALRAWLGGVEAASERWLSARAPSREILIALLSDSLAAHLATAGRLAPDAVNP